MEKSSRSILNKKISLVLLISLLSAAILTSGYFFYKDEIDDAKAEKSNELKAITELKINQIVQWWDEKRSDVILVSQSPFFSDAVGQLIQSTRNNAVEFKIKKRLELLKQVGKYESILLLTVKGNVLISVGSSGNHIDSITTLKINEAIKTKQVLLTDIYKCKQDIVHLDIVTPVLSDRNEIIAILIFRIDPYKFLFPIIQRWPTDSRSSETLLLRREGNSVLFISNGKYEKKAALNFKITLLKKNVSEVQAVLGIKGIIEGVDYRGINVLSYIYPIKDTPWFVVSKIDKDELFERAYFESAIIIFSSFFLVALLWFLLAYIYNKQQKNIYRTLWETQEEFKTTLYSIGEAVITTNEFGMVQHLNPSAEDLTGWTEKEAKNKSLQEIFRVVHEVTNEKIENPIQRILNDGEIISLTNHTLLVSKNGKSIPIVNNGAPIKNTNGKILGAVLVFRNQTLEKERQRSLKESEEKYRNLFTFTNDGICLHELVSDENKNPVNYIILDVNKKFEEITCLQKEKVIGKTATEVYNCNAAPYLDTYAKVALGGDSISFETFFEAMDKYFIISVYSPEIGKFATVFQNITERKKAEIEIINAKEKAEEMNRAKTIFFANMSHELRTPFVGIMGYADLLSQMLTDPLSKEMADGILISSRRLTDTLTKILDITKLEFEKTEIVYEECSVAEIINHVCSYFAKAAEKKNIILKKNIHPENLSFETDERLLIEVLNNLISNAIKFTDMGLIEISAEKQFRNGTELLILRVSDTGIGISQDKHEIIWEEFRQASEGYTRSYQGIGLGLSVVKRYTELLNGKVYLESEKDKGSIFTVEFPGFKNEQKRNKEINSLEVNPLKGIEAYPVIRKKVLYIEDESNARDFVKRTLIGKYDVDLAESSERALSIAKEKQYDIILMDINLGAGLDGIDLSQIIRKMGNYVNVPIIAVSAIANKKDINELLAQGFNYCLSKPFMMHDLLNLIEKVFSPEN